MCVKIAISHDISPSKAVFFFFSISGMQNASRRGKTYRLRARFRACWCPPLALALGRQKQAELWVRGQPVLRSEFQDSHECLYRETLPWKTRCVWEGANQRWVSAVMIEVMETWGLRDWRGTTDLESERKWRGRSSGLVLISLYKIEIMVYNWKKK